MNPSPIWFEPTIHRDLDGDLLHIVGFMESFGADDDDLTGLDAPVEKRAATRRSLAAGTQIEQTGIKAGTRVARRE